MQREAKARHLEMLHQSQALSSKAMLRDVVMPITRPDLIEVDELPATERGANGFGSSGA